LLHKIKLLIESFQSLIQLQQQELSPAGIVQLQVFPEGQVAVQVVPAEPVQHPTSQVLQFFKSG